MFLVHEEKAEVAPWLKLLYLIPAAMFIGAVVSSFTQELQAFFVLLGEAALFTAIFYFIIPRKFQIFPDKLKIVLGKPWSIDIPLATIKEVGHSSGYKVYAFSGIRFVTSTRYVVEIIRTRGTNYVISPQNGEHFVEQLKLAIKSTGLQQRGRKGDTRSA